MAARTPEFGTNMGAGMHNDWLQSQGYEPNPQEYDPSSGNPMYKSGISGMTMTPEQWQAATQAMSGQPSASTISGNPEAVDKYGYPSPGISSIVSDKSPNYNYTDQLQRYMPYGMIGAGMGAAADAMQGWDAKKMAAMQGAVGAQSARIADEAATRRGIMRNDAVTGKGGFTLANGRKVSDYTSPETKQWAGNLQQELYKRKSIDPQEIAKLGNTGLAQKILGLGGAGVVAAGGINAMMKNGIPWGKVGSALHIPGMSQPDYNQYNQPGGWTYDENGNRIPVPDDWYGDPTAQPGNSGGADVTDDSGDWSET